MVVNTYDTFPKLLKDKYDAYDDKKVMMRAKNLGIWERYTWKECYQRVKYFSLGLISLGLRRGDNVAIIGENRPEWFWAELAAQAASGSVVGVWTDCLPDEVKYYVKDAESEFVVSQDQEQVDKILQIKDELPLLKRVIFWDSKGIVGFGGTCIGEYNDPILMDFDQVIELGKKYEKSHPGLFEENIEKTRGRDVAMFSYTSGTTGLPKGAILTQSKLVEGARILNLLDKWNSNEQYLSAVNPGIIPEQVIGLGSCLLAGTQMNFPERAETVQEDFREISPRMFMWVPRNWENISRLVQAKMIDTSALRRFLYHLFLPVGYKIAESRLAGKKLGWLWQVLYFLAQLLLLRALKDKVGLTKARCVYTAGSAISPDIFRYFQAIGVNIRQFYGSTEMGLVTTQSSDDIRPETCGPPTEGYECRLYDNGEIMVRSDRLFSGYYKKPEATRQAYTGDWYHTGDFGQINDDGHLIIIDRMDDLKELSDGRKFSPQYAEVRLRFSAFIKDAVVVGGQDKDFVAAVINMDMDNVGRWAEARHIPYTTFLDLSQKPEIISLVKDQIQRVNKNLPTWARIKRFVNLYKEFDPDEAELTRSRKVRRFFVEDKYQYLIHAVYGDSEEVQVEAPIVYADGRKGTMRTGVKINTID